MAIMAVGRLAEPSGTTTLANVYPNSLDSLTAFAERLLCAWRARRATNCCANAVHPSLPAVSAASVDFGAAAKQQVRAP